MSRVCHYEMFFSTRTIPTNPVVCSRLLLNSPEFYLFHDFMIIHYTDLLWMMGKLEWVFYFFFFVNHIVPGCKEKWKAHNNFCFSVLTNDTLSTNEMKDFCLENKGELVYAMNKSSFHLAEQFLYTLQLNEETNSSRRVVLGPANASSLATLPVSNSSVSGSVATHTCAYSDSSQLKVETCNANNCDYLCMGLRGNQYWVQKLLFFFLYLEDFVSLESFRF